MRPLNQYERTHQAEAVETHAPDSTPGPEEEEVSRQHIEDRITAISPDGRPEHGKLAGGRLVWLVLAPVGSLLVLSAVVYFVWGIAAAALLFVFGSALALFANPEVWATYLRAQEREEAADAEEAEQSREAGDTAI